ncbi:MAG: hypothetical protein DWQ36_09165 [Acidobacteria bacterium]|nr:MAG: hypothetical protein DWQ30_22410 [Acidobacteriota bacterium]REK08529.1 MAG: hypothetical protein DWQ36_09165 [Acidobacteriota bacterium]
MNLLPLRRRRLVFATSALALACVVPGHATDFSLGPTAGTLGAGLEATVGSPRLQARAALAAWSTSIDIQTDEVDYSGDLELEQLLLVGDWYPWEGSFRISAGVAINDDRIEASAPLADLLLPGEDFPAILVDFLGTLEGTATIDPVVPYLGIGFGNPLGQTGRWRFKVDLGVLFTGAPDVELTANLNLPIEVPPEFRQVIDIIVEQEEAELRREVADYDLYPVVQVGVSYRW